MKIQNTLISILIINFNNAKLITRAINSCLDQSYKNFEILIFDDRSNDNSSEIIKKFKNNSRIHYVNLPHKGVSATRNIGLNLSKGEVIAFIDSDNEWLPEYLSLMIAFQELNNLSTAYCACLLSNEKKDELIWLGNHFDWDKCLELNYIDLNGFICKRECAHAYFDENLRRFVDWDYILQITKDLPTGFLDCGLIILKALSP